MFPKDVKVIPVKISAGQSGERLINQAWWSAPNATNLKCRIGHVWAAAFIKAKMLCSPGGFDSSQEVRYVVFKGL